MTGRQFGQSGQALGLPGNQLGEEKVLRTRAWGGGSRARWPTSKEAKSLFPPSTDVSPTKQHGAEDRQFQEGGSTQAENMPRSCHDGVWHQLQGPPPHPPKLDSEGLGGI